MYSLACSLSPLETQLLSLTASLFVGWMCLFSVPGRKNKHRSRPSRAAIFRAKKPSFVPRAEPSTAGWRVTACGTAGQGGELWACRQAVTHAASGHRCGKRALTFSAKPQGEPTCPSHPRRALQMDLLLHHMIRFSRRETEREKQPFVLPTSMIAYRRHKAMKSG